MKQLVAKEICSASFLSLEMLSINSLFLDTDHFKYKGCKFELFEHLLG